MAVGGTDDEEEERPGEASLHTHTPFTLQLVNNLMKLICGQRQK